MKWRVETAAQAELEEAAAWYETQRTGLSAEFLDEFDKGIRLISEHPKAWKPVGRRVRQYRLNRFPYGIIYQLREDEIFVVAVAHLHRRPGYWRRRMPYR